MFFVNNVEFELPCRLGDFLEAAGMQLDTRVSVIAADEHEKSVVARSAKASDVCKLTLSNNSGAECDMSDAMIVQIMLQDINACECIRLESGISLLMSVEVAKPGLHDWELNGDVYEKNVNGVKYLVGVDDYVYVICIACENIQYSNKVISKEYPVKVYSCDECDFVLDGVKFKLPFKVSELEEKVELYEIDRNINITTDIRSNITQVITYSGVALELIVFNISEEMQPLSNCCVCGVRLIGARPPYTAFTLFNGIHLHSAVQDRIDDFEREMAGFTEYYHRVSESTDYVLSTRNGAIDDISIMYVDTEIEKNLNNFVKKVCSF